MVFEYHPPGTRGQTPNKENLDLGEFYFFEVQRFIQFDQADSALYFLNELDKLESQDNSETDYYRAVAHYLKGDFKETRASLKPLLDDPSNDFHEMAKTFAKVLSRTKE